MIEIRSFIISFIILASSSPLYAEDLGRFFLTPEQRYELNELRDRIPVVEEIEQQESEVEPEIELAETDGNEEPEFEQEPLVKEPIQLKGVVYRGKSGNTAWLNEENTYEGGLASINVTVNESQIGKDEVNLQLPDNVTEVTLKVGQTWQDDTVSSEEVDDN